MKENKKLKITYDGDTVLLLDVSPYERLHYLPLLYGVKQDTKTLLWKAPIKSLLPILAIFPEIVPTDIATKNLLDRGKALMTKLDDEKLLLNDKTKEVKVNDYPFLMKHQAICNIISNTRKKFAFFLDTGTRQNNNITCYY